MADGRADGTAEETERQHLVSVDPATEKVLARVPADSIAAVEKKLAAAAAAFSEWTRQQPSQRAAVLTKVAEILDADERLYAELITREMGKPIQAAHDEVKKCATGCRYFAEHGPAFLRPQPVQGDDQAVWFQGIGAVLAIMPWNFPFWQVLRFAAPALVAGNVGLLKHASNVPQCAVALQDLFQRAGAPDGVFQTLLIESGRVGEVIADPRVAGVTLTGSEDAGRAVAATAGKHLKKSVLELGGSDPFIVLSTANIEEAAKVAVKARIVNNGQSCIAAKRFIVTDAVYDRFVDRFVEHMRQLKIGDPMATDTDVGPLATSAIRDGVERQVTASVKAGAAVAVGGSRLQRAGYFYAPTVLVDFPPEAPAWTEEVFGPVAAVRRVRNADEAIAVANETRFGLGASVWTRNGEEAARFATEIAAGTVFVNGMVASDARFPFGGVKASGYGRELGAFGTLEFVNIKTVRMSGVSGPAATE